MKTHVQVIIETRGPGNEERSANANKVDVGLEVGLQSCFAEAQRLLELQLVRKDGGVSAVLQNVLGGESAKGISTVKRGGHLYWNVFKRSVNGRGEKTYRCKKSDIKVGSTTGRLHAGCNCIRSFPPYGTWNHLAILAIEMLQKLTKHAFIIKCRTDRIIDRRIPCFIGHPPGSTP
jgi:hypothetical protein